jgi:hypothetical protein
MYHRAIFTKVSLKLDQETGTKRYEQQKSVKGMKLPDFIVFQACRKKKTFIICSGYDDYLVLERADKEYYN